MKISEKQLLILMSIVKDTCLTNQVVGGYDLPTRIGLVNEILEQQDSTLQQLDPDLFSSPPPQKKR